MNYSLNSFGKRLERALRRRGMSKTDLGERLGIALSTISRWVSEVNPSTPHPSTLKKIADELGVRQNWLDTGEEPEEPSLVLREEEPQFHVSKPSERDQLRNILAHVLGSLPDSEIEMIKRRLATAILEGDNAAAMTLAFLTSYEKPKISTESETSLRKTPTE